MKWGDTYIPESSSRPGRTMLLRSIWFSGW